MNDVSKHQPGLAKPDRIRLSGNLTLHLRFRVCGQQSDFRALSPYPPALDRVGDFAAFLGEPFDEALTYAALRKAESVGRPIGSAEWLADMEAQTGRKLAAAKRGPAKRVALKPD